MNVLLWGERRAAYTRFTEEISRTYLKIAILQKSRHPREGGGPIKPWETWIPACAGMTTKCRGIMKMNFEIGSSVLFRK